MSTKDKCVGLRVVGILVATSKETTTLGIDVALATGLRICSLVPKGFVFSVVQTVDETNCSVSETLFWGSDVFLGRTISTKTLPLLKRI